MTHAQVQHPPLAYSVADACRISSIGKTYLYQLVNDGKLDLIKVGRRSLITAESLNRLLKPAP